MSLLYTLNVEFWIISPSSIIRKVIQLYSKVKLLRISSPSPGWDNDLMLALQGLQNTVREQVPATTALCAQTGKGFKHSYLLSERTVSLICRTITAIFDWTRDSNRMSCSLLIMNGKPQLRLTNFDFIHLDL